MANVPKKISVGNRTVVGNQVLNAQDTLVQREQLNRILKQLDERLVALGVRVDEIVPGGGEPGEGAAYELNADPVNFSLDSVGENAWYLDIIPGGIQTLDLANLSVTYDKIDFTTFDSDDIVEGTTNLYFTDERAQDAVGTIFAPSTFVNLVYNDLVPSMQAVLTATGSSTSGNVLRGDNTWSSGVSGDWNVGSTTRSGSYLIDNISYDLVDFFGTSVTSVIQGSDILGARHFFVDPGGYFFITGVQGGEAGRLFTISNDINSAGPISIANNDPSAAGNERVYPPEATDYVVDPGYSVTLLYIENPDVMPDGGWIFHSTTSVGGGGGGGVTSVVAGDGIDVDSTVPAVPVISLSPQAGGITITAGAPGGPLLPVGTTITATAPNGYDLTDWLMVCDPSGDIEVDIRVVPFASYPPTSGDSITGAGRPEIVADVSASGDTSLWSDTTIAADDVVAAVITGASGVRWFSLTLRGTRTVTP